MPERENLFRA